MRQVSMGNPEITSRYFKDMRRLKTLTPSEQTELIQEYAKSKDAKRKTEIMQSLVMANQAFIVSMARHLSMDDDFNDLISEGNIGLIQAIEGFDIKKKNGFLTYAAYRIKKTMTEYISNVKKMVKPKNVARVYAYSEKTKNKFFIENGRYPTVEELMEELENNGVIFSNKEDLYDISVDSMDMGYDVNDTNPTEDDSRFEKFYMRKINYDSDVSKMPELTENMSAKQMVERSLSYLTPDERNVVCKYYGIGCEQKSASQLALESGARTKKEIEKKEKQIENQVKKYIKKIQQNGKVKTDVH
ncbi:MAG: sigma-70 family RNA polymerase sigma factor [Bacteroidales bacterium]|nr:sigma-70 family RNA polymerase sigma factor [Bacteroidales bacterium]